MTIIIVTITRQGHHQRSRQPASPPSPVQPAHVRAAALPPHARLPAAAAVDISPTYTSAPHPPSALSTYHAAGLQAEQESLPKRTSDRWLDSVGARGSITIGTWCGGKPRKPKRNQALCGILLLLRALLFCGHALACPPELSCFGLQNAWRKYVK